MMSAVVEVKEATEEMDLGRASDRRRVPDNRRALYVPSLISCVSRFAVFTAATERAGMRSSACLRFVGAVRLRLRCLPGSTPPRLSESASPFCPRPSARTCRRRPRLKHTSCITGAPEDEVEEV